MQADAVRGGEGHSVGATGPSCRSPAQNTVEELKATPGGNVPDSLKVGTGDPVAVTVKLPAVPTVNVALLTLVIAGA